MAVVVSQFEKGAGTYIKYRSLINVWDSSRIMFDVLVEEAKAEGLVTQDPDGDLRITPKGKLYALKHKLVT